MTTYEISSLFHMVDKRLTGKINQQQWNEFHSTFIKPFDQYDLNSDGMLNQEEVIHSLEDIEVQV